MFSMMPSTGTSTLRNMLRPLRASSSATSCGVVTMTAPESGTFCARVSWASPVPGGRSTTRKSSSPQSTSRSNCVIALMHHRAAPDHRRVLVDQEAHRHHLDAVVLHRLACILPSLRGRLAVDAHHARHATGRRCRRRAARPCRPLACSAERQIDGDGRLADAALAAGDRDDVLDAGQGQAPAARLGMRVAVRNDRALEAWPDRLVFARVWARRDGRSAPTVALSAPGRSMIAFSAALRTGSITGAWAGSTSMAKPTWPSAHGQAAHHPGRHDVATLRQSNGAQRLHDLDFGEGHA